jgi:UDPglucose 6-dehydrogenase
MAAVVASKGFSVIGLDIEPGNVKAINEGKPPVEEPDLERYLKLAEGRLHATSDYAEAILNSDVSFIIVPTPSSTDGTFSNRFVLSAVEEIGKVLRGNNHPHIVVVTSTVMPGSMDTEVRSALEEASGRRVGKDLGLCYNPEFIALGSVIRDMLNPDFILIGESDPVSGAALEKFYATTCQNSPPVHRMNLVNAELCKISVNTFVTTKISYANMITDMCEHLPGADANVVTAAVGADSRVGTKYLRGAIGYGGPCFPRDNKAFSALGRRLGVRCDLAEATDAINTHQIDRIVALVETHLRPADRIVVLGLSYKPDTPVVDESQGVALARHLASRGHIVTVYDRLARRNAEGALTDTVIYAPSLQLAMRSGDILIIMTSAKEFGDISSEMIGDARKVTIIDPWRIVDPAKVGASGHVVQVGHGPG